MQKHWSLAIFYILKVASNVYTLCPESQTLISFRHNVIKTALILILFDRNVANLGLRQMAKLQLSYIQRIVSADAGIVATHTIQRINT